MTDFRAEKSSCGVGFIASLKNRASHDVVREALHALRCVEHRGGCHADRLTSDGAGLMIDIPFEMLGYKNGTVALATLFAPKEATRRKRALKVFEDTFGFFGMKILAYRKTPINPAVLGPKALQSKPEILHAVIARPGHCRTDYSFDKLLHQARQLTRIKLKEHGFVCELFFTSLSATTMVYKALTCANQLEQFYLDLQNPALKSRFGFFHRRFSTNTVSTWDKTQPFRLIAHNGEINTITANKSWAFSREKALGLRDDELLTHEGMSDSGSFNEMAEALAFCGGFERFEEIPAIMMPPAYKESAFYKFWSRAMEPWDGPALVVFSDGRKIGARLDRNGFRPCRWARTETHFYLASEAGAFAIDEAAILQKGTLHAGRSVAVDLETGAFSFRDPGEAPENFGASFDARLEALSFCPPENDCATAPDKRFLFNFSQEDLNLVLLPMIREGKEPIGSMGDTARLAIFSNEPRPFFDYFYQNFAQVTNPPLDYLRESNVTDLRTYLGARPNIFTPKQLLPPVAGLELPGPILSLGQMEFLYRLLKQPQNASGLVARKFDLIFQREFGAVGFKRRLQEIGEQAVASVRNGAAIIILSDRNADYDAPPLPSLLALRAVICALNDAGLRLEASVVVDSAEIRTTHHVAALLGFGAAALCPWLALEIARFEEDDKLKNKTAVPFASKAPARRDQKEKNLIRAYEQGLLKVMSKMGISVARSYQSSKLFTAIGLDTDFVQVYFNGVPSTLGGKGLDEIAEDVLSNTERSRLYEESGKLIHIHFFKEHNQGRLGEKHAMTNARSKVIHKLARTNGRGVDEIELYDEYLRLGRSSAPVSVRHLLRIKESASPLPLAEVQAREEILKTFGAAAMSFGAISAEAQRDIFLAMRAIGARSNSGEGGESPFYHTEGLRATTKQVASARFGVTAAYLVAAEEIEIKIAQGAKPGEGGQLMGVKVNAEIARARHAPEGAALISPPPLHDIYSIEDLKQLIYELRQINPSAQITVKLVAGAHIGTIAVGVAKAGADIIHIAGGDGGTGAASLSSMKHAGLPWELSLVEAHQALIENHLRENVILRVDGGLHTGEDIVMAAILGAEQYNFGKLLLIAQGCVMARICEKNTCPTGIATHDPKFKAKYKGHQDHILKLMHYIAEDVRRHLAKAGLASLHEVIGRTDLLEVHPKHEALVNQKKLDLSFILSKQMVARQRAANPFRESVGPLNEKLLADSEAALDRNQDLELAYEIKSTDRAVLARLAGELAQREHQTRLAKFSSNGKAQSVSPPYTKTLKLTFTGSAGQGFGFGMTKHLEVKLYGEANDSVCKSMSGGKMVICASPQARYRLEENVIIGNCALYGATGGKLYVCGLAGDRFAVRNSGAFAIVEGAGLHACEYMTNGKVIILGEVSRNLGSGMTGGQIYLYQDRAVENVNTEFLIRVEIGAREYVRLKLDLEDYYRETQSNTAKTILADWEVRHSSFKKFIPIGMLTGQEIPGGREEEVGEAAISI